MIPESSAEEVAELRLKLEALTQAQYDREEQFEQAIGARDAEIARLVEEVSRHQEVPGAESVGVFVDDSVSTWRTRLYEAQALVTRRDETIAELTELLATAQRSVDADLRSISDYSIEYPKSRDACSPVQSNEPALLEEIAALKYSLECTNAAKAAAEEDSATNYAATMQARAFAESLVSEMETLRDHLAIVDSKVSQANSRADAAEAAAREAAAEVTASVARAVAAASVPHSAPMVLNDEEGDVAATNARRVAEALAAYCNLLTGKLRNFRKPVKRAAVQPPAPLRSPAGTAGLPSFPTIPSVSLGSRGSVSPAASGPASTSGLRSPGEPKVPKPGSWELDDGWGADAKSPKKEEEDLFSMLN